ncbi:MAG: ATP-binding protein [Oscillospiraceae bacterium]|nr:ATP-binding protein [Oscillospiraceae bacterium]
MENISGLFDNIPKMPDFNPAAFAEQQVEWENERIGTLTGYDCPECKNRGHSAFLSDDNSMVLRECKCLKIRQNIRNIEESGLKYLLERCKFDNFNTAENWQKFAKQQAMQYADNPVSWLYVAGQSGAGKTHLCTAICDKLLKAGRKVKYDLWRELFHSMEQRRFDESGYFRLLDEIKNTDVLYIDDFLKSPDKTKVMSMLDSAFEIINARYNVDGITIISSEMFIEDIETIDEATAGRIRQKSKFIQIKKESGRNYRIRK